MFRNTHIKTAVVASTIGLAAAMLPSQSMARDGWETGAAIAGGFVAGAIVGSAISGPRYVAPAPNYYYAPRRRYVAPAPVYYRAQPWTPAWYQYCSAKYRSFNPRTGYYLAYSGQYRFCR